MLKVITHFSLLVVFCFSLSVWAAPLKRPLTIEADSAVVDKDKMVTIYKGNVVVKQDKLRMSGSELVVKSKDKKVSILTMSGKQATFFQSVDNNLPINARADKISYLVKVDEIVLEQDVEVKQGSNVYSGDFVRIDKKNNIITTLPSQPSPDEKPGRVHLTIEPDQL